MLVIPNDFARLYVSKEISMLMVAGEKYTSEI